MPKITLDVTEEDERFLRAMASVSKLKVVDLNEHDGYRLVNHSTISLAEVLLHKAIKQADVKLKEAGIDRNPW